MSARPAPVVAIGAGSIDALEAFRARLPSGSGACFVAVLHSATPAGPSLTERADGAGPPFAIGEDGLPLAPDRITVVAGGVRARLHDRTLRLEKRGDDGDGFLPIDDFFASLAADVGERAMAVVLSGTGTDGSRGLRAVKEAGGVVLVQEAGTAHFDAMPRSAAATGLADVVLPPEELAARLCELLRHGGRVAEAEIAQWRTIVLHAGKRSQLDLGRYKHSLLQRRIEHRMALAGLDQPGDYEALVRTSHAEAERLSRDLLIQVTRFFRDPPAWARLAEALPAVIDGADPLTGLRLSVGACCTGEEAYTLAMVVAQAIERAGSTLPFKIFASDVDERSLEIARAGRYPSSIAADLPHGMLARWFERRGDWFHVRPGLRDRITFGRRDLLADRGFARMDVVTCRNFLVYLQPDAQATVLSGLRASLREGGLLMLGSSETLGDEAGHFTPIDATWRIHRRCPDAAPSATRAPVERPSPEALRRPPAEPRSPAVARDSLVSQIQADLVEHTLPPTLVVDEDLQLAFSFGDVGSFLQLPQGRPSLDVTRLTRGELALVVGDAVRRALGARGEARFDEILVDAENDVRVRLHARKIQQDADPRSLVALVLEAIPSRAAPGAEPDDASGGNSVEDLTRALEFTRGSLQAAVDDLEATNADLQTANEDLVSSNEELQIANQDFRSLNAELRTLNEHYEAKIHELTVSNDDFANLMRVTATGAIFLDADLRIRRFTDAVRQLIALEASDIGRRIHDLRWRIDAETRGNGVAAAAERVLGGGESERLVVRDEDGRWHRIALMPYEAIDSRERGVVISSVDVSEEHENAGGASAAAAGSARAPSRRVAMLAVDAKGRIVMANRAIQQMLQLDREALSRTNMESLFGPDFSQRCLEVLASDEPWEGEMALAGAPGERRLWITIAPYVAEDGRRSDQVVVTFRERRSTAGVSPAGTA